MKSTKIFNIEKGDCLVTILFIWAKSLASLIVLPYKTQLLCDHNSRNIYKQKEFEELIFG